MLDLIRVDGSTYERRQRFSVSFFPNSADHCFVTVIKSAIQTEMINKNVGNLFELHLFIYLFLNGKLEMHVCVNCCVRPSYKCSRTHHFYVWIRSHSLIPFIQFYFFGKNFKQQFHTLMSNGSTQLLLSLLFILIWWRR